MIEPLPRPHESAYAIYLGCIEGAREQLRLAPHAERVRDCAERFAAAARLAALHELDQQSFGPSEESERKLLADVYRNRIVGTSVPSPGRALYEKLLNLVEVCPLCRVGRVRTIDHHLPKSLFPYLAVVPDNLIPACSDCNKTKGDTAPSRKDEQTLHPYFDDIGDQQWLAARVIEKTPAVLEFHIEPPQGADLLLSARVRRHFQVFDLADLYRIQAAVELNGCRSELMIVSDAGGASAVHDHLDLLASGRQRGHGPNSWQAAAYRALAASDWYCGGGFRLD